MANSLQFDDVAVLLRETLKQARGVEDVGEINAENFAAVGTTALKCGYDKLLNAISTVLSRTYFSSRPYSGKFKGLFVDQYQWGAFDRKVQVVDKDPIANPEWDLQEGKSVDQYIVRKTQVLQLNFYGGNTYSRDLPIYKNQLDMAFRDANEAARFWAMLFQNLDDMVTQDRETEARLALVNFITGKISGDSGNVIHLVTEYNTEAGTNFTAETVRLPENWTNFCRWMFGRIKTLSELLTERTINYHINVTGKPISRHTPLSNQKVYLLAQDVNNMDSTVLSTTYNTQYLDVVDYETVGFWQAIDSPAAVNFKPTYLLPSGELTTAADPVEANIFGLIFDEDAIRCTIINNWSMATPMNAAGGYSVRWEHYTSRWINDFTENALVLMLD